LSSAVHIVEVAEPDLAFEPRPWQFAQTRAEAVATRWARLRREKPEVYNGRVLLMRRWALAPRINGGFKLEGDYFEVDYADFVAWRTIGDSIEPVFNCLTMAALRRADGAFLLGEKAPHHERRSDLFPRRHAGSKRPVRRQGGPRSERMSRAPRGNRRQGGGGDHRGNVDRRLRRIADRMHQTHDAPPDS
jgi:hypothetical protein